jgi:undecaprenyl-diphosphatase
VDWSHVLQVILIAIVEGLTEFLPVSSTGHMALAGELVGFKGPAEASFMVIIQLGAIAAVMVVYWRRLWAVLAGLLQPGRAEIFGPSKLFTRNVLLGFLPSMVLAFFTYKWIKQAIGTPEVIAWALLLGGIAILVIEKMSHRAVTTTVEGMSVKTALGIGLAQCLSLIPGVSRSGATIMGAMLLGVERKTAAEFTFFLAIPTMIAATVYDLYKNWSSFSVTDLESLGIGFGVAFLVALAVVKSFVEFVGKFGFAPFGWYRIAVGLGALTWLALR